MNFESILLSIGSFIDVELFANDKNYPLLLAFKLNLFYDIYLPLLLWASLFLKFSYYYSISIWRIL
jgi:hypothetical protein